MRPTFCRGRGFWLDKDGFLRWSGPYDVSWLLPPTRGKWSSITCREDTLELTTDYGVHYRLRWLAHLETSMYLSLVPWEPSR